VLVNMPPNFHLNSCYQLLAIEKDLAQVKVSSWNSCLHLWHHLCQINHALKMSQGILGPCTREWNCSPNLHLPSSWGFVGDGNIPK
jgi:hypothetical protein